MKKKLLTVLLALVFVFAGTLGITTMASAETAPSIVDVNFTNYAGFAGNCIAVNFGAKTGEDWEDHTTALSSYVSLVNKEGTAYEVTYIDTQGNYLLINRGTGYAPAVGDILTLKSGLTLDCGTLAEDVSYVYSTANQPFTLVQEETPDLPTASIVDVNYTNYAGWAGYCIAICFDGTTGADWASLLATQGDKISLENKDGEPIAITQLETQGTYVIINRGSYTAALGDKVTLKKGFAVECGAIAEDATYVYSTENAPFTLYTGEAEEEKTTVDLMIHQQNGGDNVSIDFSKAWGYNSVVTIRFDTANWGGDLGLYAPAHTANEGKVGYVDAFGNVIALDDMIYVMDGHFIARTNTAITPGSKFFIKQGFKLDIGNVSAVMAEDHEWAIISTEGHILPVFAESMIPTSIEITNSAADKDVMVGATMQIAYAIPEGTYGTPVFASNSEAATVSATGLVTGVAEGTATITATIGSASASFDVNVIPASEVTGVEIVNQYTYYVIKGEEAVLPALKACAVFEGGAKGTEFDLVAGENLTIPTIDTSVAGTQTVTLTVEYKGEEYAIDYTVEVYEPYDMTIKEIGIVEWFAFAVFVQYPDTTTNIANITDTSKVNGISDKIKYTRADGTEIGFGYYVLGGGNIAMFMQFGDGVNLDINNYNEYYLPGDTITLEAGLCGWKWTGELKATATDNAAVAEGTGMYIVECVLKETVQYRYDGNVWGFHLEYSDFTVASESIEMGVGDIKSVNASRVPDNATSGTISYTSSDESVVTVSNRGVITAIGEGTATISATISGGTAGDITKTVTVTVTDEITGIRFAETELTLNVGENLNLASLAATTVYASGKTGEAVDLTNATVTGLDTSVAGSNTVVISVEIDGATYSGAITVNVVEAPQPEGCVASAATGSVLAVAVLGLAAALRKRKDD